MKKNSKKLLLWLTIPLLLTSCSNNTTSNSSTLSSLTSKERKEQLIKAFYEYTFSKDGYETCKAHGGIIKDEDYLKANDFSKSNYEVFSLDNSDITLKVGGSTSVSDVSNAQINAFTSFFTGSSKSPSFLVDRKGSGTAITGLENNTYDIGYLSRELEESEVTKLNNMNGKSGHFCIDAVVPVVNKNNNLNEITGQQLALIYGDRSYLDTLDSFKEKQSITSFSQIDSSLSSKNINIYTRDSSSGTRECFTEKIGIPNAKKDANMNSKATVVSNNGEMISSIKNDEDSIGYVSLDSIAGKSEIKALNYEGIIASVTNVTNGSYKLQRYFNIVAIC